MAGISFKTASEFLSEQLQSGKNTQRVGVVLRLALDGVSDVTKLLDSALEGAWDKLDSFMDKLLANHSEESQRAAVRFNYAGSLRIPVDEQLALLRYARESEVVATAAARQRDMHPHVAAHLVENCFHHKQAMVALARNPRADIETVALLACHKERDVRFAMAERVGPLMRVNPENINCEKAAVYNALIDHYESDFAPALVPVCRDQEQLEHMFSQTNKTPGLMRPFVENPFVTGDILLEISSSMSLRMLPEGSQVASEAKQQLKKRLAVENDAAPRPY